MLQMSFFFTNAKSASVVGFCLYFEFTPDKAAPWLTILRLKLLVELQLKLTENKLQKKKVSSNRTHLTSSVTNGGQHIQYNGTQAH